GQPHIVQLAMVMADAETRAEIRMENMIIRPDGWTISPEVAAIHGITHERAMDEGIPEIEAVDRFICLMARCSVRIAHNESFDSRIMRIAMLRYGVLREVIEAMEQREKYCTMQQSTTLMNLPGTDRMKAAG